mmetsp:Transcript_100499/g.322487  ORF Transcript_100499/g.322487 Transcript_100499/m.322487 type:complete len:409 (-) Transcript_100499:67-1293(-)
MARPHTLPLPRPSPLPTLASGNLVRWVIGCWRFDSHARPSPLPTLAFGSFGGLGCRLLEVSTSALLPACMCWVMDPAALAPLFVLLWLLPAALRAKSLSKVLSYPLLCFVVDDVSLLGLHPTPRAARLTYAICILRTFVLYSVIPLGGEWSPLPEVIKAWIVNWKAVDLLNASLASEGLPWYMGVVWVSCVAGVLVLSLLWVVVTVAMLGAGRCGSERNETLLKQVDSIGEQVQAASTLEPTECYAKLKEIQSQNPSFELASLFNTVGPAWASVLHVGMDICNVGTLILHGSWTLAIPLAVSVCCSIVYFQKATFGRHRLLSEVKLSLQRGLCTEHYLEAVRSDKGVLRIPETVLKVYGLPFAAKSPLSLAMAIGSIAGNVALVAKFVYTEFDLGIEDHGLDAAKKEQ